MQQSPTWETIGTSTAFLSIIHRLVFYSKHTAFRRMVLSLFSGGTYSVGPNRYSLHISAAATQAHINHLQELRQTGSLCCDPFKYAVLCCGGGTQFISSTWRRRQNPVSETFLNRKKEKNKNEETQLLYQYTIITNSVSYLHKLTVAQLNKNVPIFIPG
jgi:hypothetical protein